MQEFQIITNGFDAEYGRASGGVVNIITKSGTNTTHGSAFGFLRNRYIQATNPFSTVYQPAYTRVQAGFTIGGAIVPDKTFYFFSTEITRRQETGFSDIGANNFGLDEHRCQPVLRGSGGGAYDAGNAGATGVSAESGNPGEYAGDSAVHCAGRIGIVAGDDGAESGISAADHRVKQLCDLWDSRRLPRLRR